MSEPVTIVVPGKPQPKQRPRFSRKTRRTYTPKETLAYEASVARMAMVAMTGRRLLDGPLHMDMRAHFAMPKSWSPKKRDAALLGQVLPRADLDNIAKAVGDAMNGVVYNDDRQIATSACSKVYAAGEPFVVVTIRPAYQSLNRVPETLSEPSSCQKQG